MHARSPHAPLVLRVALLLALSLALGSAWAQPGTLLEVTETGSYGPAAIDSVTAGRFMNNGASSPGATHVVDSYLIRYESTWPDGAPAEITAQLFVPRLEEPETDALLFAPGSTGLVEACAPSRPFVERGEFGTYNAYTLAYAGQGFVSMMPNYMGFFDVGTIQPYFVHAAEAHAVLDGLRALRPALEQLSSAPQVRGLFVGGYSQGGHAAFAAADRADEYAPEVDLQGVLGFGPTTGLEALFMEFTYVAPWVVYSYQTFFPGRIDPADILLEPYLSQLEADAERLCIGGAQVYWPGWPADLYQVPFLTELARGTLENGYPEIAALFAENDAGLDGHGFPAIVLQGADDPVVDIETQNEFVMQLCQRGSRVSYPNYLDTRHETRYVGFEDAIAWMRAVARGDPPPDDCPAVLQTDPA